MDQSNEKKLLHKFFSAYPLIHFEKGEKLIRPRELLHNLIYLQSGIIKISTLSTEGEERTISYLNPKSYGDIIFGLAPEENPYFIEAFSFVSAWRVPRSEYITFAKKNPSIYINLSESLLKMIQDLYEQLAWMKVDNSYTKTASAIYYLAKNIGHQEGSTIRIEEKITHQMIANLTGLTRETVSAQMKKLEDKNLLQYKDSVITIVDGIKLKNETKTDYLLT